MKRKELLSLLDFLGMRPGRGLGQNFLLDDNLLDAIVRDSAVSPGEVVLEVGPGFGVLTQKLLEAGAKVYAVEFDHRIAEYLRGAIQHQDFHLTEEDAARADYAKVLPQGPFRAIANLPYSISSIFVVRMLELPEPPVSMTFMLQKEMAERLAASLRCGAYGALSVRTQLVYDVRILRTVVPEVFFPPPEVDSAVAQFTRKTPLPDAGLRRYLPGVVKTVFAQRRKQIGKVLGQMYGKERALAALEACGLDVTLRPEHLSQQDFQHLTMELFPQ